MSDLNTRIKGTSIKMINDHKLVPDSIWEGGKREINFRPLRHVPLEASKETADSIRKICFYSPSTTREIFFARICLLNGKSAAGIQSETKSKSGSRWLKIFLCGFRLIKARYFPKRNLPHESNSINFRNSEEFLLCIRHRGKDARHNKNTLRL